MIRSTYTQTLWMEMVIQVRVLGQSVGVKGGAGKRVVDSKVLSKPPL